MAKGTKKPDNEQDLPDRLDWQVIDQEITAAYKKLITTKKIPTIEQIAKEVGCNEKTVRRHLEKLSISDRFKSFRALTGDIIVSLYNAAMMGEPKSIELWFKIVEDYSEKSKVELTNAPVVIFPGDESDNDTDN